MSREFTLRVVKEIVYETLQQYPKAVPWFVGVYDDWTIGSLKYNRKNKVVLFSSENFTEQDFYDICNSISNQIEKEITLETLVHYADFNNEAGKLAVKQLIDFVTDLVMDESIS